MNSKLFIKIRLSVCNANRMPFEQIVCTAVIKWLLQRQIIKITYRYYIIKLMLTGNEYDRVALGFTIFLTLPVMILTEGGRI
jgi:hypothetical protein